MKRTVTISAIALVVVAYLLFGVSAAAADPGGTTTPTPTTTPGDGDTTQTPDSDVSDDEEITKQKVLGWARDGRDLSDKQAEQVYAWVNSHISEFDAEEREVVQDWITAEVSGQETTPTNSTDDRVFNFGDEETDAKDEEQETRTYEKAVEAIEDGKVTESELPDEFEYRGGQIFPGLRLEYEEWEGDQTTLILRAEEDMSISLNDAWLASAETDRPAPRYQVDLEKGLNVVQMPTVPDQQNEEYIAISSPNYVETISDPYQPFIRAVSKQHIPAIAGGSIAGFCSLFVLFASFRKNRYKDRLVHVAEVLRMR